METAARPDGRAADELRPIRYTTGYLEWAEGSVLFEMGQTRVLCAASYEPRVPRFLEGQKRGWVTGGRPSGRTQEIQRLIGRSLRAVTRLDRLAEGTITVDCDVLQADGGTRTASITGGYIALALALAKLHERGLVPEDVLSDSVAAVSTGIVGGVPRLDLSYEEDAGAEVDFNVVTTGSGLLVEVQGTAEEEPFTREQLDEMLTFAAGGIERLTAIQREAVGA